MNCSQQKIHVYITIKTSIFQKESFNNSEMCISHIHFVKMVSFPTCYERCTHILSYCQNPLLSISLASPYSTVACVHCPKDGPILWKEHRKSYTGLIQNLLLFFKHFCPNYEDLLNSWNYLLRSLKQVSQQLISSWSTQDYTSSNIFHL